MKQRNIYSSKNTNNVVRIGGIWDKEDNKHQAGSVFDGGA